MSEATGPSYLMRWDHSRDQRLGRDLVQTTHRLGELPIFSDQGLADLLDRYPREAIQVSTTGRNPAHPSQLRVGLLGDHSGAELIDMLNRSAICLRLQRLGDHHPELRAISDRLWGEMTECQGWSGRRHWADLEICSPQTMVYYGCDLDPNIFCQVRGCRSLWVYPDREPYLLIRAIERMLAGERSKHLYYEPAFDDSAQRHVQTGGDLIALPQYTPYRIVNDQLLSVTLISSYSTRQSRQRNQSHLANHSLMKYLPTMMQGDGPYGAFAALKRLFMRLSRTRRGDAQFVANPPTFRLDSSARNCLGSLDWSFTEGSPSAPAVPTFEPPIAASTPITSEN